MKDQDPSKRLGGCDLHELEDDVGINGSINHKSQDFCTTKHLEATQNAEHSMPNCSLVRTCSGNISNRFTRRILDCARSILSLASPSQAKDIQVKDVEIRKPDKMIEDDTMKIKQNQYNQWIGEENQQKILNSHDWWPGKVLKADLLLYGLWRLRTSRNPMKSIWRRWEKSVGKKHYESVRNLCRDIR